MTIAKPDQLVTDEQVLGHHFGSWPEDMPPRKVLAVGVINVAFGYTPGSTMLTILRRHGLVSQRVNTTLTKKGRQYFRSTCPDGVGVLKATAIF